ncbi:MAG: restriction endonuclease [Pseudomonadota bacterium]
MRDDALIFLYRLLFLLYAEDRNLLPAHDARYDDYAFRRLRETIARRIDKADVFSTTQARYADSLKSLFRAIDKGDASIGMPPYNGGLFSDTQHPLLSRIQLPDAVLAPLIDQLSRHVDGESRRWINYRDLSVRHLGSIYERLLEFTPALDAAGQVVVRPSPFARKTSGSYYTHDDLVDVLMQRTLGPLVEERIARFTEHSKALASEHRDQAKRREELEQHDPALALLDLKVCDPAMGSGHFLVAVVDYLADQVLEQLAAVETAAPWADTPYRSPLAVRIANIRSRILESARANRWSVTPEQLDDRQIVRRMILKRVIFGVDKNPMAVELAKLALWLHTFTVGAPLSFLDHHLRTGDSLFGERVETVVAGLQKQYGSVFFGSELTRIGSATESMSAIGELTDIGIAEVQQSYSLFDDIERGIKPLWSLLDFWHALRWLTTAKSLKADESLRLGLGELLGGQYGNVWDLIQHGGVAVADEQKLAPAQRIDALLRAARRLSERETFFHWQLAFPTVWKGLVERRPVGGFDAIVGNPPWDRMKLQQVEWFAAREPAIAKQARAADRKKMIAALETQHAPLAAQYTQAAEASETATRVARECGDYPLMSSGDINLYSLFVERAGQLIAPDGVVGLITPSGIAADLGASAFFKSIATSGRLGTLFDFENRKVFFPDVHASFKFCALVFGGSERRFAHCDAAFFLHAKADLDDPERRFNLSAADFAAVNPNTGTAPIFRRRRDAEITTAIYARLPVLVDQRIDTDRVNALTRQSASLAEIAAARQPRKLWPVRYATMFHMTKDSGSFKRKDELEREGWYPVGGSRWKKGDDEAVPLYVGRMMNQYDHRAASVTVNEDNLHNAALSSATTLGEHRDPTYTVTPQFWVDSSDERLTNDRWRIGFRDIARSTDIRTFIACIVPSMAAGNKLPLLIPSNDDEIFYGQYAPLLLANLNAFALDFVTRQKVQSTNMNWFIVEQLPLIPPAAYQTPLGKGTVADFVRGEVLRLSYTAHDLAGFAADLGYAGKPFEWDEDDRRHRLARLDALYFRLYGLSRDEASYVLDQFPIVKQQDEATFEGRYRTKELVLAYYNAVGADDVTTRVNL